MHGMHCCSTLHADCAETPALLLGAHARWKLFTLHQAHLGTGHCTDPAVEVMARLPNAPAATRRPFSCHIQPDKQCLAGLSIPLL